MNKFKILIFSLIFCHNSHAGKSLLNRLIPKQLEANLMNKIGEANVEKRDFYFEVELQSGSKSYIPIDGKTIDISQYFPHRNESFKLKLTSKDVDLNVTADSLDLYFISFVKPKKIAQNIIGSSCNKVFKIDSSFVYKMIKRSVKLPLLDVPFLMQGKFFVIVKESDKQFFISSGSFLMPNYSGERCDWFNLEMKKGLRIK